MKEDNGESGKVLAAYRVKRVFKCRYCGKPGHLKRDCCIRIADKQEIRHLIVGLGKRQIKCAESVRMMMKMCYLQVMHCLFKQLVVGASILVGSSILVQAVMCARIESCLQ